MTPLSPVYFVSGIDTDVGKSYATGFLAKQWPGRVVTQKLIQTGNSGRSEDILLHRSIMGLDLLPEDREGLTMPEIYSYPASPHLAARLDNRPVDFAKIDAATAELARRFDAVLLEGAGGLMAPLTESLLTIDFIEARGYPMIFVTSGRLGSISHTLLGLEAIKRRGIRLHALVYNEVPEEKPEIDADTRRFLHAWIAREFPGAEWIILPRL